ncbi:hypothetical protein EVAR_4758_1 [Eumeta japonica]|uniref:Uncharacterized protein n=1 Tax=Eumeta variegata TaxID=151549 RepID=A0A4C1T1F8_EUMVA|nr:hypothetical protein EVAR_4758_1 [Eumeta japonica]
MDNIGGYAGFIQAGVAAAPASSARDSRPPRPRDSAPPLRMKTLGKKRKTSAEGAHTCSVFDWPDRSAGKRRNLSHERWLTYVRGARGPRAPARPARRNRTGRDSRARAEDSTSNSATDAEGRLLNGTTLQSFS